MKNTSAGHRWLQFAALLNLSAVAAGAFGAHGLKEILSDNETAIYQTAVLYQFIHGFAIFGVSLAAHVGLLSRKNTHLINLLFASGVVLFSGSLYVLTLTNIRWLGAITPVGGLAFMVGWIMLARFAAPLRLTDRSL